VAVFDRTQTFSAKKPAFRRFPRAVRLACSQTVTALPSPCQEFFK
jgi:hypothetical protein